MDLMTRVDEAVAARRLLDHPFYTAWSRGELDHEVLSRYAEQYYHWVSAFPTFLSQAHANCPDLEARREILANLNDEEAGPDNHPELWLRFGDALGLDREAVRAAAPLPETRAAVDAYRTLCRDGSYVAALAALYAYESQQPAVSASKREGLAAWYGIEAGHDFFVEHETADVAHSAAERRLIEAHAAGHADEVLAAVAVALDATYTLLDGVYREYVARAN